MEAVCVNNNLADWQLWNSWFMAGLLVSVIEAGAVFANADLRNSC